MMNNFSFITAIQKILSMDLENNTDVLSLVLSVVAILMSFILTASTYLLGNGIPKIAVNSISDELRRENIIRDVKNLLKIKTNLSKRINTIYILSIWSIIIPFLINIIYICPIMLWIGILIVTLLFVYLVVKIWKINKLALKIDNSLLQIEEYNIVNNR